MAPGGPELNPPDHRAAIALEVSNLDLSAAGRPLLEGASFSVRRGELVLLLGPSGSGKSLLLQLLAGVLSESDQVRVTGEVRVASVQVHPGAASDSRPSVGLVFQDHALLDDLSPEQNLQLAVDHGRDGEDRARRVRDLLAEFGIAPRQPVRSLSGGQRQRLAVARTLAQDPDVLIYDEPTTGLDPALAEKVATRIAVTHREHGKTSLVVTHDTRALLPIADRVLLLDPAARAIREIPKDQADAELARTLPPSSAPDRTGSRPPAWQRFFRATADAAEQFLRFAISVVPRWKRPRWGIRFLRHSLCLVTDLSAIAYMATAGVILGFVATHFTFEYLPQKKYTESLLTDEILAGLGYLLYRVLGPVLATILMAARCGAAVSADLGNRSLTRQLDGMRSLGADPRRYLYTATTWAFLIGAPILAGVLFLCARTVSELVFLYTHPDRSAFFWDLWFHDLLVEDGHALWRGTGYTLLKVEAAACGVAAIAWHQSTRPMASGASVATGITRTIIWSTLWVLFVHFAFAFFEF